MKEKTFMGYEIGKRELTESSKKIFRALRKSKVVIFQRDDSPEGMDTVQQVLDICGCIGISVFSNNSAEGKHMIFDTVPYKIVIVDEDSFPEVSQYEGKKVRMGV